QSGDQVVLIVEPDEGDLACGWSGSGRLAAPEELFYHVRRALSQGDYAGKRILISTGPTREALDPVRFISNRSSGKMGVALAREAFRRGAQVTLVHGPVRARVPREVRCLEVISAIEMRDAMMERAFAASQGEKPDVVIMAAAVADYRPKQSAPEKVKKGSASISIDLAKNPDILNELGQKKGDGDRPVLVGFAVETGEIENLLDEGRRKLHEKHADMIVGNFAEEAFDLDTNRVWLIDKHGRQEEIATQYKSRVANKILDVILKL
ncbi:MAG: bifunctional phosphopantothenoylcysteine decarboxylase/phosphopantothenate--cysteine ligase CoaBC, partial [Proteobacteria bacterium]